MAYDEKTAKRIRAVLSTRRGVTEQKMFGGVAFMINGHMACGVIDERLVLRLGEDGAALALNRKHTSPMDFTGKPLRTMVYVDPAGFRTAAALRRWVDDAVAFARTLPAKS